MTKLSDVIKVSARGVITIPGKYRQQLNLTGEGFVGIKSSKNGILLTPVEIKEKAVKKPKAKKKKKL